MSYEILDVEQGSPEWFAERLGIVTASHVSDVMKKGRGGAPSKARETYMLKLLGERLTGELQPNFTTEHTARGHEDEPKARAAYEFETGNEVHQVGFMINNKMGVGYSPDGLVGKDGTIEIKTKLAHLHLAVLIADQVPKEHMDQIMCGLLVSDRKWCDFICHSRGLPLFIKRVHRDEKRILEIRDSIIKFSVSLSEMEREIRGMMQ